MGNEWTPEENLLLMEYYPDHGSRWEGWDRLLPRRSHRSIGARAHRIGLRSKHPFAARAHDSLVGIDERATSAVSAIGEWHQTRLRLLMEAVM